MQSKSSQTENPGVSSSIPVWPHTFLETESPLSSDSGEILNKLKSRDFLASGMSTLFSLRSILDCPII